MGAWLVALAVLALSCEKKDPDGGTAGNVQLIRAKVGTVYLDLQNTVGEIPVDKNVIIEFSNVLDTASAVKSILLKKNGVNLIPGTLLLHGR